MRTKNTPLKDYVLLRDKRRNIVKKKGVVLTRVHYYIRVINISYFFSLLHRTRNLRNWHFSHLFLDTSVNFTFSLSLFHLFL